MNSSLNRKKTDMFPYELTEDEDEKAEAIKKNRRYGEK
jgi:hypothetical protein